MGVGLCLQISKSLQLVPMMMTFRVHNDADGTFLRCELRFGFPFLSLDLSTWARRAQARMHSCPCKA